MNNPPKAAIIAGGKGTRIRSLTSDLIPKALVPVAGEPIVFRQLALLARYGIRHVAVLAGHLADVLRQTMIPKAEELGIRLEFFVEDQALGTAGGLLAARRVLDDGDFLVLYGDVAVDMDVTRLVDFHTRKRALATIVAHPNDHPHESDLLRTDADGRVLEILPRKGRAPGFYRNLVPAAVYCLSPRIFEELEPGSAQDFIGDVFPRLLGRARSLYAYATPEYLRDMGSPARYQMVEDDLKGGLVERMNFSHKRPAMFLDRDGVLNVEPGAPGVVHHHQLELIPGAAEAVRLVNRRGWLAVVVTNQPRVAKGFTTPEELETIHAKLETLLGCEGAYLDRIYYCPHHPERGFEGEVPKLKIDCPCRKPKTGMIERALDELPIERAGSCLIGDSWRDMRAGRTAGLVVFGVRTGDACRGCDGDDRPDRVFADVLQAVRFVLDGDWEREV